MKKLVLILFACLCIANAHAAYLRNIPMTLTQPDGTVLQCLASGDEYFNYLHDANGYTIMRHPKTGFWVYAEKRDGQLVATEFVAGAQDPASKGLQPYALISPEEWLARRKAWEEPAKPSKSRDHNPNHGTLNNISIFIRFADDPELSNSYQDIDNMFNDISDGAVSMRSYFKAASYGSIEIPTTFYPGHNGNTIISYQDTYDRCYFEPYDATSNPNGYTDDERADREFSLLERAVNYINENYPIPSDLNIDYDEDGYVDNVCFIVKGGVGAWSSLLWPHKWSLYGKNVYIHGKRVWTFNFQLADATSYFNTSTMCHEMNHSLSAPDLYHYYNGTSLSPAGPWDLMENNANPPQHCGAYMKMKYGHWIDEIPEITQAGTYTLNPISSDEPTNVAYKIQSDDPNQFYVLEYRDKTSLFETSLPGSGLLIYRIDTRFEGNASYDPTNGIYDEVYLFRPGGSATVNGDLYSAYFSSTVGRTEFSASTSAYPFFTGGAIDNNFRIYNITKAGSTISFSYGSSSDCEPPTNLVASLEGNNVTLTWDEANNAQSYNIYRSGTLVGNTTETTFTDFDVAYGKYDYYLKSVDENGLTSTVSESVTVTIVPDGYVFIGDSSSTTDDVLPSYNYYKYSLTHQIYTASELGKDGVITSIAFFNGGAEKTRTYDFYMKHTEKTGFSDIADWDVVSETDKVFSGEVTMVADDWTFITLNNPFEYNGSSNLLLVADDNSGAWSGTPHMSCRVFPAAGQALRNYSDNTNFNPLAPENYSGTEIMNVKNQLLISKITPSTDPITISVSANPSKGGTVSGGGVYNFGETCTVTATVNDGFRFVGWTENEQVVSTNLSYSFKVMLNRNLVASFEEGILIGDEGEATDQYLPSYSYYNYSLTQQIYTVDEIGTSGTIKSIAFYNGGSERTRKYDMYLVHTDKTEFSGSSDWISVNGDDMVFSGNVTMVEGDWTVLALDTPFDYDGTSNLALIMDDNTGSWQNGMRCRVFNAPSQSIRIFSDGSNYDPLNPSSYTGTVMNLKNQIILGMETGEDPELIFEPFEGYAEGNHIAAEAIAAGHNWWTTWDNNPGTDEDGLVASYGGNKCGFISGAADNVLLFDEINGGVYDLEFDILVPEGKNGYFNVLHHFDGSNSVWAMQAYLHLSNDGQNSSSAPFTGTVHAGSNNTCTLACVYDEWMHFRIRVDIDQDIAKLYFNEAMMCQWQWSLDSFGSEIVEPTLNAMDFFAPMSDGSSEFYIDNISIKNIPPITQTIELAAGWNWFNSHIAINDLEEALLMLQESLGENGLMIKSNRNYTSYEEGEWGVLGDLEQLDVTQMYMILVSDDCTAELQGTPANPIDYRITIQKGWNWIGFPSTVAISVEEAFANFEPLDGDMIKNATNYSTFSNGQWGDMGDLNELTPGQGIMYYSNSDTTKTLVFSLGN